MSNRKDALDGANKIHIFLALHAHTQICLFHHRDHPITSNMWRDVCDITKKGLQGLLYWVVLLLFLTLYISRLRWIWNFFAIVKSIFKKAFFSKNSNLIGLWQQVNFPTSWLPTYKSGFYCLFRQNYELKATLSMHFFGTPEMWSCTIKAIQYRLLVQIELLPRFSLSP